MNRSILVSLAMVVFAVPLCHAADRLEVISLDLGGCWAHQEQFREPLWKIASFSDGVAPTLIASDFQQSLNEPISTELRKAFSSFQGSPTETFFHCSAAGHLLWTSIHEGTVPLCVWSKMQHEAGIGLLVPKVVGVFPDYEFRPGSPCSGVSRKSLLVLVNQDSDLDWVMLHLRTDSRYEGMIADVTRLAPSTAVVRLEDRYDFRENLARAAIETDPSLAGYLRAVEYNGFAFIIGEEMRLFAGTYPGF